MQAIKTKDTKGNIRHFIKQQTIHNKNVDRKEEAIMDALRHFKMI